MNDADSSRPVDWAYFNGRFLPGHEATVSIADEGLLYGLGFFETFRSSGGLPHHWRYNAARLEQSCRRTGLELPPTVLTKNEEQFAAVVRELLNRSGHEDAVFRYTITAGVGGKVTEFLTLRALPPAAPPAGIRLRTLKTRRDLGEWAPRPKSLNYANAILGMRELRTRASHPSDDGLFLSQSDGRVVETCRQNIVWMCDSRLYCPDDRAGAVAGTCLAWIRDMGFNIVPTSANLAHVATAEAVICLNAVRGITPVSELWDESDAQRLGFFSTTRHELYLQLSERWNESLLKTARDRSPQNSPLA